MKRPSKSFEIALSAIACAVATAALTVGSLVDFLLAAGYLLALFALMVPLSKNFIWGYVLAFAGAVLLSFLFCGFAVFTLLPFAVFFGLHPLLNYLERRYFKRKWQYGVGLLAKALWFDGALLLMWFTLGGLFGITEASWYGFVEQYLYAVVFAGGTLFFVLYDIMIFFCQRSVDLAVRRIGR